RDMSSNGKILMLHGHQADFFNDSLWWLSRFLVRYLWKPLESIGINDPTSASKNHQKEDSVERELIEWVKKENVMLIAGHTHRQVFSEVGEPAYFNDGSCVHPYGITAIEISDGMIMLVKWCVKTRNSGNLFVGREVLEGPRNIKDYFKNESPGV
ncbi:MAG: serine/threonine protein phosphatase, partial [Clostridia bacterium]|nr:serine/threonine protein phosphatase [Clostridia bacterium]